MDAANNPSAAQLLDRLQALVAHQKQLLADQDYDALGAAATLATLLDHLAKFAPLDKTSCDRLAKIIALHRQLCLELAAQKQNVAKRLDKLTTGNRVLRAYRGN